MTTTTLSVRGVSHWYGEGESRIRALADVSFDVSAGEIVALLGPNGAGKTTTFYILVGLVLPKSGRVFLGDVDVTAEPLHLRARRGLGYLPQEASVFRSLTTEENLLAVLEARGRGSAEARSRTAEVLEEMGLSQRTKVAAGSLSGGERRRLEIARALVLEPSLLLLDEPFAGVDPKQVAEIQAILRDLRQRRGLGILITDHNVRETLDLVDRAFILHEGRILCEGNAKTLVEHPAARRFYLGESFRYATT